MIRFASLPQSACSAARFVLVCTSLAASGCVALQPQETMLIQQSRFGELEALMESRIADQTAVPTSELFYLCYAYSKVKRYNRLFPCLDALQDNVDQGDTQLFWFDFSAAPSLMRAEAHMEFGNYPRAIEEANQAYRLTEPDDVYLQMKIFALTAAGLSNALNGNRASAQRYAGELGAVNTSYPNNLMASDKYIGLAKIHMALGDYPSALAAIRQEEETQAFKSFTDFITGASLAGVSLYTFLELPKQFILNRSLLETGDIAAAKAGFDALLEVPQTRDNGDIYWLILFDRGRIALMEGQRDEAIGYFKRAIEVIEQQRATIRTEASKIGFVGDKQDVYSELIVALFADGRHAEAFEYVERAKARALVDLLAERQRFVHPERDPTEIQGLLAELSAIEEETRLQGVAAAADQTASRAGRLSDLRAAIARAAPETASLVTVSASGVGEVQDLIGPDEALVNYFHHKDTLLAFVVTRDRVTGVRLDGADLDTSVRDFRNALKAVHSDRYRPVSIRLYGQLIRPLDDLLDRRALVVVPHGVLHYLPFNALESRGEYLIDRFAIRLVPSASVLKYVKPRGGRADRRLLALGNPDLGDPRWDLRGAEAEAREIGKRWPGSMVLLRGRASETAFKGAGAQFRYLHLASHGVFDSDRPLDSAMLLAGDGENDGRLTVGELYELELNADLITLSACETGLGAVLNGDDVVGLTRGFLYAGAQSIVASLWPVSDDATFDLMTVFYENLGQSGTREALQIAQRRVRESHPHPFYWAAFQLVGAS